LVVLLVVAPRLALDAGITWDEPAQLEYGNRVLAWFRSAGRDTSALSYRDLYLYGGLFDLPAQWLVSLLPFPPADTRHVLTALVALLGVVATWLCANSIAGARAGFIAALVLVLTPAWSGHGMFNPKDIPFGAAAAFVTYTSVRIALAPAPLAWGDALRVAVALGMALGVRAGGMFLAVYPLLAAGGRALSDACERVRRGEPARLGQSAARTLLRLLCVAPVSWAIMISAWPWAQLSPFLRPLEAAVGAQRFVWDNPVFFDGKYLPATELPWTYLPTWFAITLPETYLLATLCGGVGLGYWLVERRWRSLEAPRALALIVLVAAVFAPLAGVLIKRPVLYDAQRHFLFILPPLAALAGLAFEVFFVEAALRRMRAVGVAAVALPALLVGIDMARLHPYEYVYFNRVSGGLPAAYGHFETDYWGAAYGEAFAWVNAHTRHPTGAQIRIAACFGMDQLRYYLRWTSGAQARFVLANDEADADIILAFTRFNCHATRGRLIHVVRREGVPLVYVLERPSPKRK
jgi:hypothetical protein